MDLKIGQAWVCQPLEDTPSLLFVVGKIDEAMEINPAFRGDASLKIVSVSVTPHPESKAAGWPTVAHMPLDQRVFGKSGERPVRDGLELGVGFSRGYQAWKERFTIGDAGVFTFTVPEAYRAIVQTIDGSPLADRG